MSIFESILTQKTSGQYWICSAIIQTIHVALLLNIFFSRWQSCISFWELLFAFWVLKSYNIHDDRVRNLMLMSNYQALLKPWRNILLYWNISHKGARIVQSEVRMQVKKPFEVSTVSYCPYRTRASTPNWRCHVGLSPSGWSGYTGYVT